MFVVANRVPVAEEFGAEFEERFAKRAGEIESQEGFVRMQILRLGFRGCTLFCTHHLGERRSVQKLGGQPRFQTGSSKPYA